MYALVLEMIAACELARENLHVLFAIKHVLIRTMPLVHLLKDAAARDRYLDTNAAVWEVHHAVVSFDGATYSLPTFLAYLPFLQAPRSSVTWRHRRRFF